MNTLISNGVYLLAFAVMLGILIFVHEFGHFIVAKRLGIPVLEFGFGFPPRLVKLFTRDGTEYTLNAIPLGGFVRLHGEEDPNVVGGFAAAKASVRVPILLAGVTMNFLLAIALFAVVTLFTPPYVSIQNTTIRAVMPDSPAARVGLREGDTIVAVNGQNVKHDYPTFRQLIRENAGREVTLDVMRKNQMLEPIRVVPRATPPPNEDPLGIQLFAWTGLRVTGVTPGSVADRAGVRVGDVLLFFVEPQRPLRDQDELAQYALTHQGWKIEWRLLRNDKLTDPIVVQIPDPLDPREATLGLTMQSSPLDAILGAIISTVVILRSIPLLFVQLFTAGLPANAVVGPVGIYQFISEVAQAGGIVGLVRSLPILSMNLAIINLLPFPALDGGRLVFIALEVLRGGKRIDPRKEGLVHLVGLAILLGLMVVISYFDFVRLFTGQRFLPPP